MSFEVEKYYLCEECGQLLPRDKAALAVRDFVRLTCDSVCAKSKIIRIYGCCEKAQINFNINFYISCPIHGIIGEYNENFNNF